MRINPVHASVAPQPCACDEWGHEEWWKARDCGLIKEEIVKRILERKLLQRRIEERLLCLEHDELCLGGAPVCPCCLDEPCCCPVLCCDPSCLGPCCCPGPCCCWGCCCAGPCCCGPECCAVDIERILAERAYLGLLARMRTFDWQVIHGHVLGLKTDSYFDIYA